MNILSMAINCGTTILNHFQVALEKGLIWEDLINMHPGFKFTMFIFRFQWHSFEATNGISNNSFEFKL
jgi:hypothetical protein